MPPVVCNAGWRAEVGGGGIMRAGQLVSGQLCSAIGLHNLSPDPCAMTEALIAILCVQTWGLSPPRAPAHLVPLPTPPSTLARPHSQYALATPATGRQGGTSAAQMLSKQSPHRAQWPTVSTLATTAPGEGQRGRTPGCRARCLQTVHQQTCVTEPVFFRSGPSAPSPNNCILRLQPTEPPTSRHSPSLSAIRDCLQHIDMLLCSTANWGILHIVCTLGTGGDCRDGDEGFPAPSKYWHCICWALHLKSRIRLLLWCVHVDRCLSTFYA